MTSGERIAQLEEELPELKRQVSTQPINNSLSPQEKRTLNTEILKILLNNKLTYKQARNVLFDTLELLKDTSLSW